MLKKHTPGCPCCPVPCYCFPVCGSSQPPGVIPCSWEITISGVIAVDCDDCEIFNDTFVADVPVPGGFPGCQGDEGCCKYYDLGMEYCGLRYLAVRFTNPVVPSLAVSWLQDLTWPFGNVANFQKPDYDVPCEYLKGTPIIVPFTNEAGGFCTFAASACVVEGL